MDVVSKLISIFINLYHHLLQNITSFAYVYLNQDAKTFCAFLKSNQF